MPTSATHLLTKIKDNVFNLFMGDFTLKDGHITLSGDCLGEKVGAERVYFIHPVHAYYSFKVIEVSM